MKTKAARFALAFFILGLLAATQGSPLVVQGLFLLSIIAIAIWAVP